LTMWRVSSAPRIAIPAPARMLEIAIPLQIKPAQLPASAVMHRRIRYDLAMHCRRIYKHPLHASSAV